MTAPAPQSQPEGEYANWTLHRQPEDQVVDHRFSLWSGEHPVVLANEMPGEEGALAYIVDQLNKADQPGRFCPQGHVLLPQSKEEAEMMHIIAERFLWPERFKTTSVVPLEQEKSHG